MANRKTGKPGAHALTPNADVVWLPALWRLVTERLGGPLPGWQEIRDHWVSGALPMMGRQIIFTGANAALDFDPENPDFRLIERQSEVRVPASMLHKWELLGMRPQAICDPQTRFLSARSYHFEELVAPRARMFLFANVRYVNRLWPGLVPAPPPADESQPAVATVDEPHPTTPGQHKAWRLICAHVPDYRDKGATAIRHEIEKKTGEVLSVDLIRRLLKPLRK